MSERQRPETASILLVDDDMPCRLAVSMKLAALKISVVEAANGSEAYNLLRERPFDLAIIDLEMPVLNGVELLFCIRGTPHLQHMPAVVLTSFNSQSLVEKALNAGATSFLLKPLNWPTFGAHIEHLLRLARPDWSPKAEAAAAALPRPQPARVPGPRLGIGAAPLAAR